MTALYDRVDRGEILIDENTDWVKLATEVLNTKLPGILSVLSGSTGSLDMKTLPKILTVALKEYLAEMDKKEQKKLQKKQ